MSMFDNYTSYTYTAYNICPPRITKSVETNFRSPMVGYDCSGNPKSFMWCEEESFNLKLTLDRKIYVLPNSIIYNDSGLEPTINTVGVKGQRAYNTVDRISWICKGTNKDNEDQSEWLPLDDVDNPEWEQISNRVLFRTDNVEDITPTTYIWEKDSNLVYVNNSSKQIDLTYNMTGKTLRVEFLNFRHELIYSYDFMESSKCVIKISKETTPELVQGQFIINTYIVSEDTKYFVYHYNITIVENMLRTQSTRTRGYNKSEVYITTSTIQDTNDEFIWEPLATSNTDDDYIWIPI